MDQLKIEQSEVRESQAQVLSLNEARGLLNPTQEQVKFLEVPHPLYSYLKDLVEEGKKLIVIGEDHSEPEHQRLMINVLNSFFFSLYRQTTKTGSSPKGVNLFLEIHKEDEQKVRDFIFV